MAQLSVMQIVLLLRFFSDRALACLKCKILEKNIFSGVASSMIPVKTFWCFTLKMHLCLVVRFCLNKFLWCWSLIILFVVQVLDVRMQHGFCLPLTKKEEEGFTRIGMKNWHKNMVQPTKTGWECCFLYLITLVFAVKTCELNDISCKMKN